MYRKQELLPQMLSNLCQNWIFYPVCNKPIITDLRETLFISELHNPGLLSGIAQIAHTNYQNFLLFPQFSKQRN